MTDLSQLKNRDYTLLIDKSGSMATRDQPGNRTRWEVAYEGTVAIANKMAEFDPDGITVYTFGSKFKRYDDVTPDKVQQVWQEGDPMGGTALHLVLKHALDSYFERKAAGTTKANGEMLLVVTDGEPDDRIAAAQVIIDAANRIDRDEELAISFIQVGNDGNAQSYLKSLDDDLTKKGAKFDIVDTLTFDQAEGQPLTQLLVNAITD